MTFEGKLASRIANIRSLAAACFEAETDIHPITVDQFLRASEFTSIRRTLSEQDLEVSKAIEGRLEEKQCNEFMALMNFKWVNS